MRNDLTGRWGEETAAAYLRRRHYLVFVEVKLRKSAAFAEALEFVDRHKQERIRRTAELYLCEHPEQTKQPRFDVIEVYAPNGTQTKRPEIRHLEDAFS